MPTEIEDAAIDEILRRGGEVAILGEKNKVNASLSLAEHNPATGLVLMRAEGWRHYRDPGHPWRYVELAYVYGTDDAGPWAVRVPGTMKTLADALSWMEPAAVTKAKDRGRRIKRQGDIYAVETTRVHDGTGVDLLPAAHEWRQTTRYLIHHPADGRKHRPLRLPFPVRFIRQRVLEMGRSGAWANGD